MFGMRPQNEKVWNSTLFIEWGGAMAEQKRFSMEFSEQAVRRMARCEGKSDSKE
jgi:hypothetical protein